MKNMAKRLHLPRSFKPISVSYSKVLLISESYIPSSFVALEFSFDYLKLAFSVYKIPLIIYPSFLIILRQVKDIMVANIDSIVERGERLELLVRRNRK